MMCSRYTRSYVCSSASVRPHCTGASARAAISRSTPPTSTGSGPRRPMRWCAARSPAGSSSARRSPVYEGRRAGRTEEPGRARIAARSAAMSSRKLSVEGDGGSRGNPGPAGYGALVKDAITGRVLAETAEAIGRATNNVAEYKGLIAGLAAAQRIAPGASVEVRMDSKLVVEQMSGRWQIKHPDMRPLAEEARRLAGDLGG